MTISREEKDETQPKKQGFKETADFVTFTEEMLHGKLCAMNYFLYGVFDQG